MTHHAHPRKVGSTLGSRTQGPQIPTLELLSTLSYVLNPSIFSRGVKPFFLVPQVNDTQPLWFFSSANNDCKSGMVLAINAEAVGTQTPAAFKQNAQASNGTPATSATQPSSSGSPGSSSNPSPSGSESTTPSPSGSNTSQNNGALTPSAQLECVFAGIVAFIGLSLLM